MFSLKSLCKRLAHQINIENSPSISIIARHEPLQPERNVDAIEDDLNGDDLNIPIENDRFEESEIEIDENRTVHESLETTVREATYMMYAFCTRHNLDWTAMENLGVLMNTVLGNSSLPTSKYFFKNRFARKNNISPAFQMNCSQCNAFLGNKEMFEGEKETICTNCNKTTSLETKYKKNHFITIPVGPQITAIIENSLRNGTLNRETFTEDGVIKDVYDGSHYKELKTKMGRKHFVTLTLSTDGGIYFIYYLFHVSCL